MNAHLVIELLNLSIFVGLAAVAVVQWTRRRTPAAAWLALSFGVLGTILLVSRLIPTPTHAANSPVLVDFVIVGLVLFPYCLYRFGAAYSHWARRREMLARVSTALLVAATLAVPEFPGRGDPQPWWYTIYTLAVVVDWTILSLVSMGCLWRAGRGHPPVARRRMQTLGMAAVALNVSIVLLAGGGRSSAEGFALSSQLAGLVGATLFLIGFVPPRALRAHWRRAEVKALRAAQRAIMVAENADDIAGIILPQAVELLGAQGAVLVGSDGRLMKRHLLDDETASGLVGSLVLPSQAEARPSVRPGQVAIPLRSGWLVLKTTESAPFFGKDELAILETLSHLAGLALDRAELSHRDKVAAQLIAEREAQLAEAQRTAQLGSYTWDIGTDQVNWSDELYRVLGFTPGEVADLAAAFLSRVHPADLVVVREAEVAARNSASPSSMEYRIVLPGGIRWIQVRSRPILGEDGVPVRVVGTVQDTTERKTAEESAAHHALHDSLTGLPNRTLFFDRLAQALARRTRPHSGIAVLFLDIDHFKWLNDSQGHAAGDELLVHVARRLVSAMRPGDTVARLGGDEFVVLCENVPAESEAEKLAERLAEVLAEPVVIAAEEMIVTVSVGIAYVSPSTAVESPEAMVRDADAAMYEAKERGRDRHEVFKDSTRVAALTRHETVNALRRGIDRGELVVHYQPELDLTTGRVVGVEALVRWDHPQRGLLAPGEFITLAEESGLIVPLGAQVLGTACHQVAAWQPPDPRHGRLSLSVNLAARQLMAPNLCAVVEGALASSGLAPELLCLEITESVLLEESDASGRALDRLKGLGVQIGVDDFGTGFSSLTYLKRFPVDILKIDRSFVDGLGHDREDRAIVASVVDLAHAFGLTTVAEGVETVEQMAELQAIGCELGQGYLWSRPLEAGAAGEWIAAHRREADLVAPRGLDAGARPDSRQRILIVEDDRSVRQLLRMVFEGDDRYDVVGEAKDGREAIALARHYSPQVVLLDLAMPGMGGLEALPLIMAVAPDAKVVVFSGLDQEELAENASRQGALAFFPKGKDPTELLDMLEPLVLSA